MMELEPLAEPVTACRACGGQRTRSLDYVKRFYLSNLDLIVEVPYAACLDCDAVFQQTYVGDAFLNHYYARSPMLRRTESTRYERDQYERQSAFVERNHAVSRQRVLEIGAGSGGFLQHLHDRFGCDTYFDELSAEAAATMLQIPGLRQLRPDESDFDIVVLRHVLEHVNDLDAFLRRVAGLLRPAGVVFVEVPDWTHFDANCDPLIFEHLTQFSGRSLIRLFDRLGWDCIALEKSTCLTDPATPNRVVRAVFQPREGALEGPRDVVRHFQEQYLPLQRALADRINALVRKSDQRTIALYPASHLSYSVLLETDLAGANVVGMFDIDRKKHGKAFKGVPIRDPSELSSIDPDIILITTMAYEDEIRDFLGSLRLRSRVVSLKGLMESLGDPP